MAVTFLDGDAHLPLENQKHRATRLPFAKTGWRSRQIHHLHVIHESRELRVVEHGQAFDALQMAGFQVRFIHSGVAWRMHSTPLLTMQARMSPLSPVFSQQ